MPVWLVFQLALVIELVTWAALAIGVVHLGGLGPASAFALWLLLPLSARALVLAFGVVQSRRHGVRLAPAERLDCGGWCRYLAGEWLPLCLHPLLQLPFPWLYRSRCDRGRDLDRDGPVVLLQHGYSHNGAVWWATVRALERRGYRVFTIDQPFWEDIDRMAERLAARIEAVSAAAAVDRLTLVAHSMGGLIARAYLRRHGADRLDALITIGSPHHGTRLARLAIGPNGRQMRPCSPWLDALNRSPLPQGLTVVSIWSVHDTIVVPQDSARLPGAVDVRMHGTGHVAQPAGRATRRELLRHLPPVGEGSSQALGQNL